MPTVAEIMQEGMARKGYTQTRLARETEVTSAWINMILKQKKGPGAEPLLRIADVLGIDRGKLVRQAHHERAYKEWTPYLAPTEGADAAAADVLSGDGLARAADRGLAVIGSASAGADVVSQTAALQRGGTVKRAVGARGGKKSGLPERVKFHPECKAIRVDGGSLEPVAYDGQYVVVSPVVHKEDIPDGAIVYVTYELPGDKRARAMIKRLFRFRLPSEEEGGEGLPVYVFTPVNTHLRPAEPPGRGDPTAVGGPGARARAGSPPSGGSSRRPYEAMTLPHRHVREMHPAVGVIFEGVSPDA